MVFVSKGGRIYRKFPWNFHHIPQAVQEELWSQDLVTDRHAYIWTEGQEVFIG